MENKWAALEAEVGAEICDAMKELYSIYSDGVVDWFANLYDPKVGGFYYSNSARDDATIVHKDVEYPLYPDSESTCQALGFISSSGMAEAYYKSLPEWMKEQIKKYVMSLQDESGFFYNPQWPKEETDKHISRRARDLSWCTGMLDSLGVAPTYDTPNGVVGSGLLYDGTKAKAVAKKAEEVEEPKTNSAAYAPHLENDVTFKAYLEGMLKENRKLSFYSMGNQLTAEMPQIIKRAADLKALGAEYDLVDIVIEWLNEHQNPENGLWELTANYLGVNGLLKISGVYSKAKCEIPNAERAALSAINAITSDEPMGAVVDLYNTWFAVGNILDNLRKYGKTVELDGEMLDGEARAEKIIKNLRAVAAPAIRKSAVKISRFAKPDGSFSYCPDYPAITSQGMPVCTPYKCEGDVNATVISVNGIKNHIYRALDINNRVPLFGEREFKRYIAIIEENKAKCEA